MVPSSAHRLGLRVAALLVLVGLAATCAGPSRLEEAALSEGCRDVSACFTAAETAVVAWADQADLSSAEDKPEIPMKLPPIFLEVTDHAVPVLSTDGSHDIPNAAATHDAELDREAAEGMVLPPAQAGPTEGQERAAADLDQSIA